MYRLLIFLFLVSFVGSGFADDYQKAGRYTAISTTATDSQLDLLAVTVELKFPGQIKTVGKAITYLLTNSGYRLASTYASDPALPVLLNLELPSVHRKLGPMPMRAALRALSSTPWKLIVDPVNRLMSFELKSEYQVDVR